MVKLPRQRSINQAFHFREAENRNSIGLCYQIEGFTHS